MAQIGCFVPCDAGGIIGIVDHIFVRMQNSNYNTIIGSSTFFTDVHQVTVALKNMTSQSVLLIDEFGKGTDLNVGISMFAGLIEYFCRLAAQQECPRILLATHFNEVIQFSLVEHNNQYIAWKKMKSVLGSSENDLHHQKEAISATLQETSQFTFLYRLVEGQTTQSWGIHCANLAGIPKTILHRASSISSIYSPFLPLASLLPEPSNAESLKLQQQLHHFFSWCDDPTTNSIKSIAKILL